MIEIFVFLKYTFLSKKQIQIKSERGDFMVETQAKHHHLVPQTYMSAWAHINGTLNVEFLNNPGKVLLRNKEKIARITDFHSIKAGMPICTKADADTIFASLMSYTIEYNGKIIRDTLEMNEFYYDF